MPNKTPAKLPDGIEIFRAGRRTADSGEVYVITESDVAATAAAYDPALHEAPLTVGHPEGNHPAYGWVKSLQVGPGGVLTSSHSQVEPQFAEMVADGRLKKRSASFYLPDDPQNPKPGVWSLRHVAYLGAKPPSVKGLKDIQFSDAGAARAVNFSESIDPIQLPQENPMDKELQAQLDAANKATAVANAAREAAEKATQDANAKLASFSEQARADRKAGFVSFAEAHVKTAALLPKDKDGAIAAMEALADVKPVEFSEGDTTRKVSPLQWLQDFIATRKPAVHFGEFAPGTGDSGQASKDMSDAEVDKRAKAHMAAHKGVNYAEALSAVTASFTS